MEQEARSAALQEQEGLKEQTRKGLVLETVAEFSSIWLARQRIREQTAKFGLSFRNEELSKKLIKLTHEHNSIKTKLNAGDRMTAALGGDSGVSESQMFSRFTEQQRAMTVELQVMRGHIEEQNAQQDQR